jgi:hypothetical protein
MVLVHGNYEVVSRDNGSTLGFGRLAQFWFLNVSGDWKLDRDFWVERSEPFGIE